MPAELFFFGLFLGLLFIWATRILISKDKEKVIKEGPWQMRYEDGKHLRKLSINDLLIFGILTSLGIGLLIWMIP